MNGTVDVAVTVSEEPLSRSPTFTRGDNTTKLSHIHVEHSIANENVSDVRLRFRVSKARLDAVSTLPKDVALYRYEDGEWNELPTALVSETADAYVFEAKSPGLSDFATGAKQPQFELREAFVNVESIRTGEDVEVQVRITNTGGADGSYVATLLFNDAVVEERSLTIASGGTRQVLFTRSIEDAGRYEVQVNDQRVGEVMVEGEPTATPAPADSSMLGGAGTAVAGVALAVVVIGGAGVAYYRREQ